MDKKLLITPVVTPLGLPSEEELEEVWPQGLIRVPTGEWQMIPEQLRDGAPEHFHNACRRLLESLKGKTDAILVGGTTGEGVGFWIQQYSALLSAMKKACPPDIRIMAGLLGRDDMVRDQAIAAYNSWISETVLGLNHTGDNQTRFDNATSVFGTADRLWLYNMPTFQPASLAFIEKCMQDWRVVGIKDSSEWTDGMRLRYLLDLKSGVRDFQVLAGKEEVYGDLQDPDFDAIDGLVSGNSNVDPELLRKFTDSPRSWGISAKRAWLHERISKLSRIRSANGRIRGIENHIIGLKMELCELGILEPRHLELYSPKLDSLFQVHQEG